MGYKVIYYEDKPSKRPIRIAILTMIMFSLFLGWTFRHWEQGRALIFDLVLKISEENLNEALQVMSVRSSEGGGFGEILHAFFRTIFSGGIEDLY